MLECFGYLLPHLRFQQCPVRIFGFVSCDQPKADSDIDAHKNDKRRANAKRHLPAARGNIYFGWEQNLARISLHPQMNLSRDSKGALQLPIGDQLLLQRCSFRGRQSPVQIIEKLIRIHSTLPEALCWMWRRAIENCAMG